MTEGRTHPPVVALVGATASGKSALALAAAKATGRTEIVVVDAMQVYRDMDIGTAKPGWAERAVVRHHCIDLVDPGEEFTVAEHQSACAAAMADIAARGDRALLVAGTGLYLRAAIDRLRPPGRWPAVRTDLEAEADTGALHARLAAIDPAAAARMEPTNRRRVIRALEVCLGSGRPFSSYGPGLTVYPDSGVVQIGLRWPRPAIAERVERRFLAMVEAGLLAEVAALAERPEGLSRTASQALGYKELLAHRAGACSLDEAIERAVSRTRRYATRQLRWFQRDPRVRWMDMEADGDRALAELERALS